MRIRDLLAPESIQLNGSATGKEDVLNQMVSLMVKSGKIADEETYRKGVFAREEESTTGIGEGIAIPHCKSAAVKKPGLSAMVLKDGVDFDALDGEKVHLIFLIAAPDPLRVIPACVVGSAIAGAMSMAFNCTLMAPHGGIFVFLVMGNAIWYLLSLIVGSAVSCLLLGLLKKKIV